MRGDWVVHVLEEEWGGAQDVERDAIRTGGRRVNREIRVAQRYDSHLDQI